MSPTVLTDDEFSQFCFWLDDKIQDGILYEGEMFCRILTVSTAYRAKLYHYACRFYPGESLLLTLAENGSSLWVSLRSPNLEKFKADAADQTLINIMTRLSVE